MDNNERDFIKKLLTRNLTSLCRNSLPRGAAVHVDALIGVTLSNSQVILVNINQALLSDDEDIKEFAADDRDNRQFSSAVAGQKRLSTSSSVAKADQTSPRSSTRKLDEDDSLSQTECYDTEDDDDCAVLEGCFDSCSWADNTDVDEYRRSDRDCELPLVLEVSAGECGAGDVTGPYLGDELMVANPAKRRKISDIEAAAESNRVIGQPLKSLKPGVNKKLKHSTGDIQSDEVQDQLHHRLSKQSSQRAIRVAVKLLSDYADRQEMSLPSIEQLSSSDLDKYLAKFFATLNKSDGSFYSSSSLKSIKYGLQHHFRNFCGIDIFGDPAFRSLSKAFAGALAKAEAAGKGEISHKQPLTSDDYNKLYFSEALDTDNPVGLQYKVFVDVMLHLCHRGQETLRYMKVSLFDVVTDHTSGKRYVCMKDFLRKNRHGDVSEVTEKQGARMYERLGDPKCPVLSFEKYVSKLNKECTAFWQKPNRQFRDVYRPDRSFWYHNIPVGRNALVGMMRSLSVVAGLSTTYTNHCIRATPIRVVERSVSAQMPNSTVPVVPIQSCSRNVPDGTRRETIGMAVTRYKRYE